MGCLEGGDTDKKSKCSCQSCSPGKRVLVSWFGWKYIVVCARNHLGFIVYEWSCSRL